MRQTVPLWLLIPLYAVPVAWLAVVCLSFVNLDQNMSLNVEMREDGTVVPLPSAGDNLLSRLGTSLVMAYGAVDWRGTSLFALIAAAAVIGVHRWVGRRDALCRLVAAIGLALAVVVVAVLLTPVVAATSEDNTFLGPRLSNPMDSGVLLTWVVHAIFGLVPAAMLANLALSRAPAPVVTAPTPSAEPTAEPGPSGSSGSTAPDVAGSDGTRPSEAEFPEPAPRHATGWSAGSQVTVPSVAAPAVEPPGPGQHSPEHPSAPTTEDRHAAYRRPD